MCPLQLGDGKGAQPLAQRVDVSLQLSTHLSLSVEDRAGDVQIGVERRDAPAKGHDGRILFLRQDRSPLGAGPRQKVDQCLNAGQMRGRGFGPGKLLWHVVVPEGRTDAAKPVPETAYALTCRRSTSALTSHHLIPRKMRSGTIACFLSST